VTKHAGSPNDLEQEHFGHLLQVYNFRYNSGMKHFRKHVDTFPFFFFFGIWTRAQNCPNLSGTSSMHFSVYVQIKVTVGSLEEYRAVPCQSQCNVNSQAACNYIPVHPHPFPPYLLTFSLLIPLNPSYLSENSRALLWNSFGI
jgi:hypothetical protein